MLTTLLAVFAVPDDCVGTFQGCFLDAAPAPGVPPVRVVDKLVSGPVGKLTVPQCCSLCSASGYPFAGLTGGPHAAGEELFCYCGCSLNRAAPAEDVSKCNSACVPAGAQHCGGNGVMSTYSIHCSPAPPPSTTCANGTVLPDGPACSQAASRGWAFCNTSLSLEARVADLVGRLSMAEAGGLLTARQSPRIDRLGVPPFYWGTNAIHGVRGNACAGSGAEQRCATTFPQALNLGSTWNRTLMRGVGRTIGREMRALANLNISADGLTSWSPTINIIRDPRWGRAQETISEDPLLAGTYGAEWSLGMQWNRNDTDTRPPPVQPRAAELMAVATLKHLTGYSLEQWSPDGNWSADKFDRIFFDAEISPLDMASTYTPGFRRAIERGGAAGVMVRLLMLLLLLLPLPLPLLLLDVARVSTTTRSPGSAWATASVPATASASPQCRGRSSSPSVQLNSAAAASSPALFC